MSSRKATKQEISYRCFDKREKMYRLLPGQIYRHYNGTTYEVIVIGYLEEGAEPVVVYKSLHASSDYPVGTVWVRRREIWDEQVERDGEVMPRFELVD